MKQLVTIKSFPHGISLHFDGEAPFEEVLEELEEKIVKSADFFKGTKIALSISGREVTSPQEHQILRVLSLKGKMQVACIVDNSASADDLYVRALQKVQPRPPQEPFTVHRGSLTDGESVECSNSLLIIGDIDEHSRAVSSKNVIVIGSVLGEVYAGTDADESHFIAALSFHTEKLKIAGCEWEGAVKSGILSRKKKSPQIALVRNHKVVTETLTKESLNGCELKFI